MPALIALSAVLGLAVGSFLNVVIWRIPRGESVVNPPSHCPACGAGVRPRDNVPVLGWLVLRGRCRDCRTRISARYPAVEALTAVLFAAVALRFGLAWELPAFLYLAAIAIALTLIDVDVHRLPDAIVLPSYIVGGLLLLGASAATAEWSRMLWAVVGLAALWAFYFLLVLVYPRGMGWGDVKLAGVLGMYLAWLGWAELVVGAFGGFLLGGVVGAGLMLAGRAGRKSKIPFGPFMLVGALIAIFAARAIASSYLRLVGL